MGTISIFLQAFFSIQFRSLIRSYCSNTSLLLTYWISHSKNFKSWKSPIVFETVVANLNQLHSVKSKPTEKIVEVLSNDIIRIEGQPICKGDDQTGKPFYGVIKRNNDGDSRTASKLYCSSLDSPLLCQSSYHFLAIGTGIQDVIVMLMTSLCWWLYYGDWFQMLVCHQYIWSPTSVTNIDVTAQSFYKL